VPTYNKKPNLLDFSNIYHYCEFCSSFSTYVLETDITHELIDKKENKRLNRKYYYSPEIKNDTVDFKYERVPQNLNKKLFPKQPLAEKIEIMNNEENIDEEYKKKYEKDKRHH
jgi:hypothetical protein